MLSNVQFSCFLLSYLVAFAMEVISVLRSSRASRLVAIGFGLAGIVAQSAFLVTRSRQVNLPPLLSSTQDWLLVLAWLAVLLYLAILALDRKLPLGVFVLPIVLVLIGVAWFANDDPSSLVRESASRRWLMLHVSSLVIGSGGVLLGFALSMMYLLQHRRLRQKVGKASSIALPNLEKLAALNWWSVVIAVPLLTIGFVSGIILGQLSQETTQAFSFTDPTVVAHGVVWVVMAALFYRILRRREASGKSIAWQTIWAFGFLIATIVGLELITVTSFHTTRSAPQASSGGDGA